MISPSTSKSNKYFIFIAFGFHPPWNEGSINIMREIIRELLAKNINVRILSIKRLVPESHYVDHYNGAQIYYISPPPFLSKFIKYEIKLPRFVTFLLHLYYLVKAFAIVCRYKIKVDVVFLGNVSFLLFAPLFKYAFHSRNVAMVFKPPSQSYAIFDNFFDAYLCFSRRIMRRLVKLNIREEKIFYHLPLPLIGLRRIIGRAEARKLLKLPSTSRVITYLGSLTEKRLPKDLLRAHRQCRNNDIVFLIIAPKTVSSYSYLSRNQELLSNNSKIIVRVQNLTEIEKILVFYATDFIIFPYESDEVDVVEPPLTLLESMSKGCIPIVTKSCSMDEVIVNKVNGIIVKNPLEVLYLAREISHKDIVIMKKNLRKFARNHYLGTSLDEIISYISGDKVNVSLNADRYLSMSHRELC